MRYWWVNQSATYAEELAGQFLWAPVQTRDGRRQPHWETMRDIQPGDRVVHYARKHVRAISRVATAALDYSRPASLPGEKWSVAGRKILSVYETADEPIPLTSIPEASRRDEPSVGPFNKSAGVKQGYLYQLSDSVGSWLETELMRLLRPRQGEAGASDAASTPLVASSLPARELLQSLLGVELRTSTGSRNLILSVGPSTAVVATERSLDGREVDIADVQLALDKLYEHREVEISPESVGHRSSFVGAVLLTLPGARIDGTPPVLTISPSDVEHVATGIAFEGELSRIRASVTRGEQAALRRRLFGTAEVAECAICGRIFPVRFLVAAHIKRRAICNDKERRLLDRIAMPACIFGCDALFELGYLSVDGEGRLVCAEVSRAAPAVFERLEDLRGRTCSAYSELAAPYFEWHLRNVFVARPSGRLHTPG